MRQTERPGGGGQRSPGPWLEELAKKDVKCPRTHQFAGMEKETEEEGRLV